MGFSIESVERLKNLTVPTIANAIEVFDLRPANQGFCGSAMVDRAPDLPMLVGYAVTCKVQSDLPASDTQPGIHEYNFWDYVDPLPGPKVVVCQDLDKPAMGAHWGEFFANVYRALGCSGAIVEGAVRDLEGAEDLGFHFFSTDVLPTHAYGRYVDFGGPVRVAGLIVNPGDLIVADRHGVLTIPAEIDLDDLVDVGFEIDRLEQEIFSLCQSKEFSLEELKKLDASVVERWPRRSSDTALGTK